MADAGETIRIPYKPRKWAVPFHASFKRFMALVLHRRAGKTMGVLNHHQRAAMNDGWETKRLRLLQPDLSDAHIKDLLRYRVYAHILPTYRQAKLTSWEPFKYYASKVVGAKPNESELRIDYPCPKGHLRRVQLFGADDPDKLRGSSLAGCSLDEYGQHPPNAFGEVLSKALADHLGYAIFAGTIKGKNQLYRTWDAARKNPDEWFSLWQDINVSLATEEDASAVVLRQAYSDDMKLVAQGLMSQEEFDQEWHLSTEAAIRGAYYAKQIAAARKDGRLTRLPYDPALPVDTDWDLGMADKMTIWFSQSLRTGEVRLIDYYQNSDYGIEHYANVLKERGYSYGEHWAPADINVRELGTGKSRLEVAKSFGIHFKVTPKLTIADGIDAVRRLLPRCWFDEAKCEAGIEGLTHYRKGWDERLQQFKDEPEHDWASHPADSFRGLAVRHRPPEPETQDTTPWGMPQQGGHTSWMA